MCRDNRNAGLRGHRTEIACYEQMLTHPMDKFTVEKDDQALGVYYSRTRKNSSMDEGPSADMENR